MAWEERARGIGRSRRRPRISGPGERTEEPGLHGNRFGLMKSPLVFSNGPVELSPEKRLDAFRRGTDEGAGKREADDPAPLFQSPSTPGSLDNKGGGPEFSMPTETPAP
jgi:hypothetical protein